MKKALLFVLVVVMVFAMAAPAFAAGMVENEFGDGQLPNIWGQYSASVKVLHALEVNITGVNLRFGDLAPGQTGTGGLTVTVKSNDAFKKSFKFQGATPDAVLSGASATLSEDGAAPAVYTLGATVDHAAATGAVSVLALSLTPGWDDAAGAHTNQFQVGVWQE
jgi:hypothetical protein